MFLKYRIFVICKNIENKSKAVLESLLRVGWGCKIKKYTPLTKKLIKI